MADIKAHLNNIKGALYGKDVRSSIYNGIEAINKEVENTTGRQVSLENTFDQLIINAGNSNAEIVDARVKSDGTSYSKLGDRLDETDLELENNKNKINTKANIDTVVSNLYNTEGFINKILDVCQTYTDNFDKLVYGNVYTAWDDTVQTVNGKYELDCSSFINLLIHGVKFHNSRYNGKDDNYGSPLFFNNIDSYKNNGNSKQYHF